MAVFEYKVVPAPTRGLKAKGVKGTPARFAYALETVMNELGVEGWEYQRTDTLPVEERQGLTGKTSSFQNMLVFRRTVDEKNEVAGLIEDQTIAPAAGAVLAASEAQIEQTGSEETEVEVSTTADGTANDKRDEVTLTPEAQERVEETLKSEGHTFPWSNRRKSSAESDAAQVEAD